MILMELNGVGYGHFVSISVTKNIENVSDAFSFTVTANEKNVLPVRVDDKIRITIDGERILTGYVESLRPSYDSSNHIIEVSGRNILCDLVDSTVGERKDFDEPLYLNQLARIILDDIGLKDVNVINNLEKTKIIEEWDLESAEIGEKAFHFLEILARKYQTLLIADGDGNLVITRASDELFPYRLVSGRGRNYSNIKSAFLEVDHRDRYHKYKANSNVVTYKAKENPETISEQEGIAIDNNIRESRTFEFNFEEGATGQTATDRAIWESNIRMARSLTYSVVVQGHSIGGRVWSINTLIDVDDSILRVQDQLFVKSVVYNQSLSDGTTTRLNMTYRNAYTLEAEEKVRLSEQKRLEAFM